ncbi:hypothetical protein [Arthrobacter sp. NPDC056493]|uniref:hypothetical protein n=1 Tax=Arthrobacter sp. NPDC056493 TaxID=3345839 RepID=UPI0036714294
MVCNDFVNGKPFARSRRSSSSCEKRQSTSFARLFSPQYRKATIIGLFSHVSPAIILGGLVAQRLAPETKGLSLSQAFAPLAQVAAK